MIISNLASRLLRPFANAGAKATIPLSQTDATRASYEQGFPALNMTPIAAGGVPPSGQDFNGVLYDLSNAALWQQAAGILPWDAGFAQSPVSGGYPKNALVVHNAVLYQSSVDNNTETPGAGTNWQGVGVSNASQPQHAVTRQQMQDGLAQHTHPYAPLASPALTGNPTAPTPAQFDNDTSIATTEFVQRALGNMSGFISYSETTTLIAADAGKYITGSVGGITLTLPDATSLPAGTRYYIQAAGAGAITVASQNGDFIGPNVGGAATFVLQASVSSEFIWSGSTWYVSGGSGYAVIAANGYQKLPSGLIIQWGVTGSLAGGGSATVTYPIAFPNGALVVTASLGAVANSTTPSSVGVQRSSATQLIIRNLGVVNFGADWIAIGY